MPIVWITTVWHLISYANYWWCPHSMQSGVYEIVKCPSVCPTTDQQERQHVQRVWYWAPNGQEISTDSSAKQHGIQQQMQGESCWQPKDEAEHKLVQCRSAYTHTHPFNGPLSVTTQVSRYQKGKKPIWICMHSIQWCLILGKRSLPSFLLHLSLIHIWRCRRRG